MQHANMQDIASAAGVSQSTVSRVLNGSPRVRASTRERVEKVLADLNYRPDPTAANLVSRRWQGRKADAPQLMYLYTREAWLGKGMPMDYNFLREAAEAMGYGLQALNLADLPSEGALRRRLWSTGIVGAIFAFEEALPYGVESIMTGLPCINAETHPYEQPVPQVVEEIFDQTLSNIEAVLAKGEGKLALLMPENKNELSYRPRMTRAAFFMAQHRYPKRKMRYFVYRQEQLEDPLRQITDWGATRVLTWSKSTMERCVGLFREMCGEEAVPKEYGMDLRLEGGTLYEHTLRRLNEMIKHGKSGQVEGPFREVRPPVRTIELVEG